MGDEGIADIGAGAAFVVDDDLLAPDFGELLSNYSRVYIGRSARGKRHNHVNSSIRPRVRLRRANEARHNCRCST